MAGGNGGGDKLGMLGVSDGGSTSDELGLMVDSTTEVGTVGLTPINDTLGMIGASDGRSFLIVIGDDDSAPGVRTAGLTPISSELVTALNFVVGGTGG